MSTTTFFGHPKGLQTLFFTEMWERFSYYGMRAILILYMVSATGLHMSTAEAATLYGLYTMSVYLFSLPGGFVADRYLGARKAVLWGGILIALGHFAIAFTTISSFYIGLGLIVLGTGLLKPSISALVGNLYSPEDNRRDAGFSLFYMGINIGAFMAPFICGYLGQKVSWHYGFGAAGVGMTLGLIQYVWGQKSLNSVSDHTRTLSKPGPIEPLTRADWLRMGMIFILFFFSGLFWMAFEQAGSSLNLFADQLTRHEIFGIQFPSSWLQAVNPIFIIMLAPLFSWLWIRLGSRQPSSAVKFSLGLFFAGLGFFLLAWASRYVGEGAVSPLWLVGVFFLHTCGELCLSPVGLSMVSKLAPRQLVSFLLGIWFVSVAFGNYAGGYVASFFNTESETLVSLFNTVGFITAGAALLLLAITPLFRLIERKSSCTQCTSKS